ncbi:hypothetical protein V8E55_004952 [Tylopilus felleus]
MRFRPNTYCFVLVLCCLLRVMSSRFKCADMCGRTFTEPRSLSRHQDVCVSWRRHLSSRVEQRQQAAALVHSTDRDEERDPKRQKLNSDQPIRVAAAAQECSTDTGGSSAGNLLLLPSCGLTHNSNC